MDTSRDDVGIAIRSAFLAKGTKQRFSLFALIVLSSVLIFLETIEAKPLNYVRSFLKDAIYRGALIVSTPSKVFTNLTIGVKDHINLYSNYSKIACYFFV